MYREHGLSGASLRELIHQAPPWAPGQQDGAVQLRSCSVRGPFAAPEKEIAWMCYPFAAKGLASIIDALPKVGKTIFLLSGIHASLNGKPFLGRSTKKMRTLYISEQSRPSLAMQMRQVGFTGEEAIEDLRIITREDRSRFTYPDLLSRLAEDILNRGAYDFLAMDTFHSIARLEDERDASEVNKLGNQTLDLASQFNLALTLGRHDRKSGGEIGAKRAQLDSIERLDGCHPAHATGARPVPDPAQTRNAGPRPGPAQ